MKMAKRAAPNQSGGLFSSIGSALGSVAGGIGSAAGGIGSAASGVGGAIKQKLASKPKPKAKEMKSEEAEIIESKQ